MFIQPEHDNFDILVGSPCQNVGNNADLPPDAGDLDWDGNTGEIVPKDLNMDNRKIQMQVDIGAYEAPADTG